VKYEDVARFMGFACFQFHHRAEQRNLSFGSTETNNQAQSDYID
jgi:hypothetical protein